MNKKRFLKNLILSSLQPFLGFVRYLGYDIIRRRPKNYAIFLEDRGFIVEVEHLGFQLKFMVGNPNDVIQKIHLQGSLYEREELAIIEKHYFPGTTFVDIGSNVGNHAIWAAKCLSAPQVIAFEPSLGQHTLLCCNVALNDLNDVMVVRKVALSSRSGMVRIPSSFAVSNNSGAASVSLVGLGEEVKMSTGDLELADIESLFIKIDVEGHEISVLEGLRNTIRQHCPRIFIEVDRENEEAFRSWLEKNEYRTLDQFKRYPSNCNYIIAPKN